MSDTVSIDTVVVPRAVLEAIADDWEVSIDDTMQILERLNATMAPKLEGHKWAEGFDKPMPDRCDDCLHIMVCRAKSPIEDCPDYLPPSPVEGMADLHGTTGDPLPGNVVTEEWLEKVIAHTTNEMRRELDKAIAALKAELMPEIRRAQYPKVNYTSQDDGDAD